MSQHDLTIANQGFPAFRADLNSALQALGSCQSGTSAPSPTFANQLWYDSTNNILKIRNEDNDAWISIATLDQTNDVLSVIALNTISEGTSGSGVTVDGVLLKDNAVTALADSTISGLTVGKGGSSSAIATAVGSGALAVNQSTGRNSAFGYNALTSNTSGNQNTALGDAVLYYNTTGASNTGSGYLTLFSNTTGGANIAFGANSLYSNTTADNNTAVGYTAMYTNTTGQGNTALGRRALYFNTTASNNTALGNQALYNNTTGTQNNAVGVNALVNNTTGGSNIAIGVSALEANTTASSNIAIGINALSANTTGNNNVAVGHEAAALNTLSGNITAIGYQAGYTSNRTGGGGSGSYLGFQAGYAVTQGYGNTFVGEYAGSNCTTGAQNICIGFASGTDAVFNLGVGDNRIVMGYNASTNAYIKVAWTVTSDARDKTSITPIGHGLEFVKQLNPVSYNFKKSRTDDTPHGNKRYGFLAQDILALEGNDPIIIDNEDEDNLKYNGEALVPVLVKAIQELKSEVDSLKQQLGK